MTKTVTVTYDSEILGSGEFWTGTVEDAPAIRNLVARDLALYLFSDDCRVTTLTRGMWAATLKES